MSAPTIGSTWIAKLHSEPWFPAYLQQLNNAGVPEWMADAVVAQEDSSLSLTALAKDAPTLGIFQFNPSIHGMTIAQAEDPVYSASKFAAAASAVIAKYPNDANPAYASDAMLHLEDAGWPGLHQYPVAIAELPTRVANANEVIAQLGGTSSLAGGAAQTVAAAPAPATSSGGLAAPLTKSPVSWLTDSAWQGFAALVGIILILAVGALLIGKDVAMGAVTHAI